MKFNTLDGLRGLAAIAVAILHMSRFFSPYSPPNAHLAVDFFFLLSGFVLAHAYDGRIEAGMPQSQFVTARIARLYPSFLMGLVLGAIVALAALIHPGALSVEWSPRLLLCSLSFGIVMMPTPSCGETDYLYPFNPVMWSILFELLISFAFFWSHRLLLNRTHLVLVAGISGILLVWTVLSLGTVDLGTTWPFVYVGILRVIFSFSLGVWLRRIRPAYASSSSVMGPLLVATLLGLALLMPTTGPLYSLAMIFVAFPLIVFVGSYTEPAPGGFLRLFAMSGTISYVLYSIHKPAYQLAYAAFSRLAPGASQTLTLTVGVVFFIGLLALCLIVERRYEQPARRLISGVVKRRLGPFPMRPNMQE